MLRCIANGRQPLHKMKGLGPKSTHHHPLNPASLPSPATGMQVAAGANDQ